MTDQQFFCVIAAIGLAGAVVIPIAAFCRRHIAIVAVILWVLTCQALLFINWSPAAGFEITAIRGDRTFVALVSLFLLVLSLVRVALWVGMRPTWRT